MVVTQRSSGNKRPPAITVSVQPSIRLTIRDFIYGRLKKDRGNPAMQVRLMSSKILLCQLDSGKSIYLKPQKFKPRSYVIIRVRKSDDKIIAEAFKPDRYKKGKDPREFFIIKENGTFHTGTLDPAEEISEKAEEQAITEPLSSQKGLLKEERETLWRKDLFLWWDGKLSVPPDPLETKLNPDGNYLFGQHNNKGLNILLYCLRKNRNKSIRIVPESSPGFKKLRVQVKYKSGRVELEIIQWLEIFGVTLERPTRPENL